MTAPLTSAEVLRPFRVATGGLHHALDNQLPIARADASLQDYVQHLHCLRPWLQEIRQVLIACRIAELDRIAERIAVRLEALELDLVDAGGQLGAASAAGASGPSFEDAARNTAFAWGLAYVVEGSQLGGAVMRRRLGERFAPHPMRYFSAGSVDGTTTQWREFVVQLGEALSNPAVVPDAQRGAVAAFERLILGCGLVMPKPVAIFL